MSFDPNVPEGLKEIQSWFASIITQPIAVVTAKDAPEYISASPTMQPEERIKLYNQQYWWRLLNTLQNTFPLTVRLLGYRDFNELIGYPYLLKYPSHHWSLSYLGDRLPKWMREDYTRNDQKILADAAEIDWAYNAAFFAAAYPSLSESLSDPVQMMEETAFLQPHIHLFKLDSDLFNFRQEIKLKDPDFWSSHHFPTLQHALAEGESHFPTLKRDRTYHFILYRNEKNQITYQDLSETEYFLLKQFETGGKIQEVIETLELHHMEEAKDQLQSWTQKWISKKWLRNI